MPDTKISNLAEDTTPDAAADWMVFVDVSDTSMAASGTTQKIHPNDLRFTMAAGATGAIQRKLPAKLGEVLNIADFGAVLDGATDDTAAFQAAINAIAAAWNAGRSRLLITGVCRINPAAVNWSDFQASSPKRRLTIIVDGTLQVTSTLILTARISLIGIGGVGTSAQFQIGPACVVSQVGTWTQPVIQMQGTEDHYLEGVYIESPYGPGIQVGYSVATSQAAPNGNLLTAGDGFQSALFSLNRVGVTCRAGTSTSEGLRVENSFWVYVSNFAFNSPAGAGAAVHIADSFPPMDPGTPSPPPFGPGNTTGLLRMWDGVVSGNLIKISRTGSTALGYHFWFDNVHTENSLTPVVTIGTASVAIDDLQLFRIGIADQIAGESAYVDNTVGGTIKSATISSPNLTHLSRLWIGRPPLVSLRVPTCFRSFNFSGSGGYNEYVNLPFKFSKDSDGEVENCDGFRGGALLPSMVPADAKNLITDQVISGWTATNCSVSSDQALDGSATGYKLTFSAAGSMHTDFSAVGITDHFLIAGCWIRPDTINSHCTDGGAAIWEVFMLSTSGHYWDGNTGTTDSVWSHNNLDARKNQNASGWMLLSEARKLNATSTTSFRFVIRCGEAATFLAWRPFLIALPAAEYSARDVSRFLSKLGVVNGAAPPGVLAQLQHQTFRTGTGATGSRPSASAVGKGAQWFDTSLNSGNGLPIWSDGTSWRNAAGTVV